MFVWKPSNNFAIFPGTEEVAGKVGNDGLSAGSGRMSCDVLCRERVAAMRWCMVGLGGGVGTIRDALRGSFCCVREREWI